MGENELDLDLVKRVQRGDKTAFDLLVRKYQHRIGAVVGRFVSTMPRPRTSPRKASFAPIARLGTSAATASSIHGCTGLP